MASLALFTLPAMLWEELSEDSSPAKASATLLSMGTLSSSRLLTASIKETFPLAEPPGEDFVLLSVPTDTPVLPMTEPVIMPAAAATFSNWSITVESESSRFAKSIPSLRISI